MAFRLLFGVLCLGAQAFLSLHGASSGAEEAASVLMAVGENCEHHTTTTSQFEEYFDIDRIGNNRTDQNVVDLTLFVQVRNMQEELAILLSASNRSRQHPDYGRTYEVRISNVYTVIYKETLRMSAHHSHNFNFFPGEQFRLRIQITRAGHITVSVPGLSKSLILTVHDERPPIEVSYISFGSRMNAYPVTFYFHCVAAGTEPADELEPHGDASLEHDDGSDADGRREDEQRGQQSDDEGAEDDGADRGNGRRGQESGGGGESPRSNHHPTQCPVCPKPEKCEVIVKACSDTSKDLLMQASGTDSEKQKYFFYFNVYLSSKGESKGATTKQPTTDAVNQIA